MIWTRDPKFKHKRTGLRYKAVDLTTANTGRVYVMTEADSQYLVRFENLEEVI